MLWLAGMGGGEGIERGWSGGRGLASEWRGECPPLARGGERGEMSGEEGWWGVGVSPMCGARWLGLVAVFLASGG